MNHIGYTLTSLALATGLSACNPSREDSTTQRSSQIIHSTKTESQEIMITGGHFIHGVEAHEGYSVKCSDGLCELRDKGGQTITGWINTNEGI